MCMAGEVCVIWGMHGRRGHAWWGACMVGGMCGVGHAWWEACIEGGVHGRGVCMAGGGMCGGGHACHARPPPGRY